MPPPIASEMASEVWLLPSLSSRFVARPLLPTLRSQTLQSSLRQSSTCLRFRSQHGKRRKQFLLPPRAAEQQGQVQGDEVIDSKILPYCSISKKAEKRTIGEMEQDFLQALQSFYYDNEAIMSNEEFDNLKEELMWEGSSVVMLSSDEQRFLEASMAYVSGNPILSDKEFDALKLRLKQQGSKIVQEGPRCSLRSRKVYSDLTVDYFKMFLLNVPAAVIALILFFFLDDLTGFEITYLLEGPCPNCGVENVSFFGTILSIPSGGVENTVKCSNCGTAMSYDSRLRLITLPETSKA